MTARRESCPCARVPSPGVAPDVPYRYDPEDPDRQVASVVSTIVWAGVAVLVIVIVYRVLVAQGVL